MDKDELKLEFEGEGEGDNPSDKKNDSVKVGADLFTAASKDDSTPPAIETIAPARPVAPVTKIADARAQQVVAKKSPSPARPGVVGSSALKESVVGEGLAESQLREELKRVSFEAEVRVATAEYKGAFLAELLSDTKVMQLQIEQLLLRIHAKNPALKQEVLMIKKILADFTSKKRK